MAFLWESDPGITGDIQRISGTAVTRAVGIMTASTGVKAEAGKDAITRTAEVMTVEAIRTATAVADSMVDRRSVAEANSTVVAAKSAEAGASTAEAAMVAGSTADGAKQRYFPREQYGPAAMTAGLFFFVLFAAQLCTRRKDSC
jgi:hypothetical protein